MASLCGRIARCTDAFPQITKLTTPQLIGWAAHPGDMEAFARRLREAGISFEGPRAGSRARPDGHTLSWKSLMLDDDANGLLPFFIEWSADSVHPSVDAPSGCRLARFTAHSPEPEELTKRLQTLGLDMKVERAKQQRLEALLAGPKGNWSPNS